MKCIFSLLTLLFIGMSVIGQQIEKDEIVRTIEVTGSAEMNVDPDIIKFTIVIQEYWEEEFQPNKEYKDYKTKVPISGIENQLLNTLYEIGFEKEDIVLKELGNYWRHHGKEFLIRKEIEINIDHFDQMQVIANKIDPKGIQGMRISEVNHTEIGKYRNQIKKEALLAAREKAGYLTESIGEELGRIITIQEISDASFPTRQRSETYSNMMLKSAGQDQQQVENFRKLELRYEIRAVFEIKE
ncbi:MAG: DUF541 domain-containing protein [Bacteroidetes bacterium]|jgi:uncharacterized protein YggE|nr:DUF541 domain-containing protein [Bacteroidota bacterium]